MSDYRYGSADERATNISAKIYRGWAVNPAPLLFCAPVSARFSLIGSHRK